MAGEFDFPSRVYYPKMLFGKHADTKPLKTAIERFAIRGKEKKTNPFDDADALAKTLEESEWGDAVIRYPPLPDASVIPYARRYYLYVRGKLVARRGTAKAAAKAAAALKQAGQKPRKR